MKYLKKINELFEGDYDHFTDISPEQAYKELDDEVNDLYSDSDDIDEEVDELFSCIEEEGLDPYTMSFEDFYKWSVEHYRLDNLKSAYEEVFRDKVSRKNPNQLKLPFYENKKIKSFNQLS